MHEHQEIELREPCLDDGVDEAASFKWRRPYRSSLISPIIRKDFGPWSGSLATKGVGRARRKWVVATPHPFPTERQRARANLTPSILNMLHNFPLPITL